MSEMNTTDQTPVAAIESTTRKAKIEHSKEYRDGRRVVIQLIRPFIADESVIRQLMEL